jgi:two-component system, NtrC family, response regulator HydG
MNRKRLLLVDDDPAIRIVLQEYLESHGHAVETAENGRVALTKLEQAGYDAVVTDYNMPEVNGLALLQHIQQYHPLLPVVMMTAERSSHVAVQSFVALGAQACLLKPFDLQQLEEVLKRTFTAATPS